MYSNSILRGLFYSIVVLFVMMMLAACDASQDDKDLVSQIAIEENEQEQVVTATDEQPQTRKIKTVMGDIEIPAEPKRVVAQGYLATFLALGVKPVGAPFWDIEAPHIKHLTDGIEDVGTIELGSIEKILSLEPDLIVTLSTDPVMYEKLSQIAPTIVYEYNTLGEAREEIKTFGAMLGREAEAEAWIVSFNETVAAAKERLRGVVGEDETVTLMGGFEKDLYVYSHDSWRGAQAIYEHLGLKRPSLVEEMKRNNQPSQIISQEKVPEFTGDYLFVEAGQQASFDPKSSIWKNLKAVKENRVFILDSDYFWPFDPEAVKLQVDLAADMIIERAKENQNAQK